MMTRDELLQALDELPRGRSAWIRGVRQYAREMVADLDPDTVLTRNTVRRVVLNGATDARAIHQALALIRAMVRA